MNIEKSSIDWLKLSKSIERRRYELEFFGKMAARLLSVLRENNITKEELSEKTGIDIDIINKMVKGNDYIPVNYVKTIEKELNCKLYDY